MQSLLKKILQFWTFPPNCCPLTQAVSEQPISRYGTYLMEFAELSRKLFTKFCIFYRLVHTLVLEQPNCTTGSVVYMYLHFLLLSSFPPPENGARLWYKTNSTCAQSGITISDEDGAKTWPPMPHLSQSSCLTTYLPESINHFPTVVVVIMPAEIFNWHFTLTDCHKHLIFWRL